MDEERRDAKLTDMRDHPPDGYLTLAALDCIHTELIFMCGIPYPSGYAIEEMRRHVVERAKSLWKEKMLLTAKSSFADGQEQGKFKITFSLDRVSSQGAVLEFSIPSLAKLEERAKEYEEDADLRRGDGMREPNGPKQPLGTRKDVI